MKPTNNRVYCHDSKKLKMLFETEKKAQTFLKFNREEIEQQNGHAPVRAYYCPVCGGWHVTSRKYYEPKKDQCENVIERYQHNQQIRQDCNAKAQERRTNLGRILQTLKKNTAITDTEFKELIKEFNDLCEFYGNKGTKKAIRKMIIARGYQQYLTQ